MFPSTDQDSQPTRVILSNNRFSALVQTSNNHVPTGNALVSSWNVNGIHDADARIETKNPSTPFGAFCAVETHKHADTADRHAGIYTLFDELADPLKTPKVE
jgi:hypothetical protein